MRSCHGIILSQFNFLHGKLSLARSASLYTRGECDAEPTDKLLTFSRLQLTTQTTLAATAQSRAAANTIAGADAEIARFKDILRQIDELETEFDKVRHIRDIVKGFRARVEGIGRGLRR